MTPSGACPVSGKHLAHIKSRIVFLVPAYQLQKLFSGDRFGRYQADCSAIADKVPQITRPVTDSADALLREQIILLSASVSFLMHSIEGFPALPIS